MTSNNDGNNGKKLGQNISSSETRTNYSINHPSFTEGNYNELSNDETNQSDSSQFSTRSPSEGSKKIDPEKKFDSSLEQHQEDRSTLMDSREDACNEVNLSPLSSAEVELDSNENGGIEKSTEDSIPRVSNMVEYFPDFQNRIIGIEQGVEEISAFSHKMVSDIKEIHKLYHTEYAGRLKSMQDELEQYREKEKGRFFDDILKDIASLYTTYESIADKIADEKIKKQMTYLFDDILQILQANGVSKQKSNLGDKRNTRHCQVVKRIETDDPNQHDTVVQSCGTGFYIENRNLIKEPVKIYLYSEAADGKMD